MSNSSAKLISVKRKKSTQELQDEIFRKMSAEKKVKLWSQFWIFAKKLQSLKKQHGSPTAFDQDRQNP
jgi:hypothetical protein